MRKGREHEFRAREGRVIVRDEAHVYAAEARLLAAPFVRGRKREPHARVARNERAQLASGVAAGTEDSDRDSMHAECILLHRRDVNRSDRRIARTERLGDVLPPSHALCYRLVELLRRLGG
jgi:hypothetical protein